MNGVRGEAPGNRQKIEEVFLCSRLFKEARNMRNWGQALIPDTIGKIGTLILQWI